MIRPPSPPFFRVPLLNTAWNVRSCVILQLAPGRRCYGRCGAADPVATQKHSILNNHDRIVGRKWHRGTYQERSTQPQIRFIIRVIGISYTIVAELAERTLTLCYAYKRLGHRDSTLQNFNSIASSCKGSCNFETATCFVAQSSLMVRR